MELRRTGCGADDAHLGPKDFLLQGEIGDLAVFGVEHGDGHRRLLVQRRATPTGCRVATERTIASKAAVRPMTKSVAVQHVNPCRRCAHPVHTADPAERAERLRIVPIDVDGGR
jgi:hypothetical protein